MRNIFFNRQSSKLGLLGSLVAVVAVAIALVLIPQKTNIKTLAENCQNPPTTPTLNPYPVTFDDENPPLCHDRAAIDAAKYNNGGPVVYSQSESDWQNGLNLNIGEQGVALMYIHNGAANNLPGNQTMARNVKITTNTHTGVGSSHPINVNFAGDNTNVVNKTFTVHTPANAKLEVVPNSGFMYDYFGNLVLDQQNLNLGNSVYTLGDLDACFEYSIFLTFRFKVVADTPANTSLGITKEVRSLDRNTNFASSVNVDPNERVQYKSVVRNTGNTTATNVQFTDNGVNGVQIESGSVTVDGLHAGTLPGTLSLGDIPAGGEKTIVYNARAGGNAGTFVNTATAVASNAPSVSASATVIVQVIQNNPNIAVNKLVKNLTTGGSYAQSTNAKTNERVNFKVTVSNTGDITLRNVVVTDPIPAGLQFDNSVVTNGNASFNNNTLTVNFGNLGVGQSNTVEFAAKVTRSNDGQVCNVATANSENAGPVNDNACVNVSNPPVETRTITVNKLVKNNNQNTAYADSVGAKTGEWVNFKVTATNTGNAAINNFRITDTVPGGLTLDQNSITSTGGNVSINGATITANFGTVGAGQSRTLEFAAQVVRNTAGQICNVGTASGDGANSVNADACVNVSIPEVRTIAITKLVKNNNQNTNYADSVGAKTGEWVNFKVTATNTGNATINNFRITDAIPAGLELDHNSIVTSGNVSISGSTITVNFGSVAAGQSRTLEFATKVVRNTAGTICNVGTASGDGANSVNADACVNVTPPPVETRTIAITKLVKNNNRDTVYADSVIARTGEWVNFKVTATNTGNATINNFKITDPVPAGLELDINSIVTNGSVERNGGNITVNFGSVASGQSRTLEFAAKVVRTTDGTICNVGTASGDGANSVNADACVNIQNPPPEVRTLLISKLVKIGSGSYAQTVNAKTGETVTFKVTITNSGSATIDNVKITDVIPSGFEFANAVVTTGSPSFNGSTLTVNFGSLAAGQSRAVEFNAKVTRATSGQVCNIAVGSGDKADTVQDNACVNVTPPPVETRSLQLSKLVKTDTSGATYTKSATVKTGDRVFFKVTVTNTGNASINNVKITDQIPSGMTFDDSVQTTGSPSFNSNTLTVTFGTVPAGQSRSVEFAMKVAQTTAGEICNTAFGSGDDVKSADDKACVTVTVTPGTPNIVQAKTAFNNTKNADAVSVKAERGNTITFTLKTTNSGTADSVNYIITDDLSGVLPLADLVDLGGATLEGNILTFPAVTIKPGETITKTFQVKVKSSLAANLSFQIKNTYGNTVVIDIPGQQVFQAPTTGVVGLSAFAFAGLMTAGFAAVRRRKDIMNFITA
ncbi:DUF11 domain-containing protein [bacterium]|nr:MAG: DUF11 domain-containing protein [bacterium]